MALLIGLVIGSVLGLTGAGGSVFAVPLLIFLLDLSVPDAVGVAMGAVAASAIYGTLNNWRSDSVLWIQAGLLGLSGVIAAPLGRWLGSYADDKLILLGFSLLAITIAVRMLWQAHSDPDSSRVLRSSDLRSGERVAAICRMSPTGQFQWGMRCVSGLLISGAVVGLLTGLFGVGGGFLIVPLLIYLTQVSIQQAIATSLVIIAAVSSSGFASYLLEGSPIAISVLLLIALGGIAGMAAGQMLGRHLAGPRLQQIFALSLILISVLTLLYKF